MFKKRIWFDHWVRRPKTFVQSGPTAVVLASKCELINEFSSLTVTNLPPGRLIFIDIRAYKNNVYGDPFTIPIRTEGVKDEVLNFTAILSKEKKTSVQVLWRPPKGEQYKGKELEYEVHYTNMIHRTSYPGEMSNGECVFILLCSAIHFAAFVWDIELYNKATSFTRVRQFCSERQKAPSVDATTSLGSRAKKLYLDAMIGNLREPFLNQMWPQSLSNQSHILASVAFG